MDTGHWSFAKSGEGDSRKRRERKEEDLCCQGQPCTKSGEEAHWPEALQVPIPRRQKIGKLVVTWRFTCSTSQQRQLKVWSEADRMRRCKSKAALVGRHSFVTLSLLEMCWGCLWKEGMKKRRNH
eukprot:1160570-Pelagomonas_calceolata.AAC.1